MAVRNRVLLVLGGGCGAAVAGLPLLTSAPNRLLSGRPLDLSAFPAPALGVMLTGVAAVLLAAVLPQRRGALLAALAGALAAPAAYLWGSGVCAAELAANGSPLARTAFGAGGWLVLLLSWLTVGEAVRGLSLSVAGRVAVAALAVGPAAALLAGGGLEHLALMKEFAAKRDLFADALVQHGRIVVGALLPTVAIGLPLGVLVHRMAVVRGPVMAGLGVIQTIPSLALFGLLIDPLSRLAVAWPWLGDLGIRGVGMAPAVIALTLYSLLPVVRNTAEGLAGVPFAVIDAAAGMGMTRAQIFRHVELPLALPVVVSGLRITAVQAVGLAAVAGLIGAGGLGALMFQGLFANAGDLILLGAVPVVAMAVAVDGAFRLLVSLLRRRIR